MKRSLGLTMLELLVGLAIGSIIVIGTVFVYNQTRSSYSINEAQARLQENARYALAIIEADVQLAGLYGYTNNAADIIWDATGAPAADMEPEDTGLGPSAIHQCRRNFAINVMLAIEGSNDDYTLDCAEAAAAGWSPAGPDVLTIRRTSTEAVAPSAAYLQLYTNRLLKSQQRVFISSTAPGTLDDRREVRNLTFRSYYIGNNSQTRTGYPTLWRKSFGSNGGAPAVLDEEILPGVEDFQVQFGVDTGDRNADGTPDTDTLDPIGVPDTLNGVISRWIQPGDDLIRSPPAGISAQVVAVRVWLRLRAETPEVGFQDVQTYQYAGRPAYTPAGADRSFRRLLVSRTFYVRNARVF
jgi:type IV pilus assembly protein PilW